MFIDITCALIMSAILVIACNRITSAYFRHIATFLNIFFNKCYGEGYAGLFFVTSKLDENLQILHGSISSVDGGPVERVLVLNPVLQKSWGLTTLRTGNHLYVVL